MCKNLVTFHVSVLYLSASKGLFSEFLQCLRHYPSEGELFELVNGYETVCKEQVFLLKKLIHHATRQEEK